MDRACAWVKIVQEYIKRRPTNWGKNLTVMGAIRLSGWVQLTTQFVTTTAERFVQWLKKRLLPKLAPREILVMDNLRAQRDTRVAPLYEAKGITIKYQPPSMRELLI